MYSTCFILTLLGILKTVDLVSIVPISDTVVPGSNPIVGRLMPFVSLKKEIIKNDSSVEVRWRIPDGTYVNTTTSNGRIQATVHVKNSKLLTDIIILHVSYNDAGVYVCEVKEKGVDSNWTSAEVQLILLVVLNASESSVTVYNNVTTVELSCDMAGYIPENATVRWYKDSLSVPLNYRTTVSYRDGSRLAQRGFTSVNSSVNSTLAFTPPLTTDRGTYECRIIQNNSQTIKYQEIELIVLESSTSIISSQLYSTQSPQLVPTNSTNSSVVTIVVGVIGSLLTLLAILIMVLIIIIGFVCFKIHTKIKPVEEKSEAVSSMVINNQLYGMVDSKNTSDIAAVMIDKSKITLIEQQEDGEFATLYKGTVINEPCTVKTLKCSFNQCNTDSIINEVLTMKSFNHLNILPLIGVCLDLNEAPCIVMPYMNEGSLLSYLRREKVNLTVCAEANDMIISEARNSLLSICLQVANGMIYLTGQYFVHKSLTSSNCMITADGIVKITFDVATDKVNNRSSLLIKWTAPETIRLSTFNEKTDVWSYGVLCWEVFSAGSTPYSNMSPKDVMRNLNEGYRLEKPTNAACSEDIYQQMVSCWDEDPRQRPIFSELESNLQSLCSETSQFCSNFMGVYSVIKQDHNKH